jgi:hypothetical protein
MMNAVTKEVVYVSEAYEPTSCEVQRMNEE